MELNGKRLLVCDCEGTMPLSGRDLAKACGVAAAEVRTQLCRRQIEVFRGALGDQPLLVACTQEAPLFAEVARESGAATELHFTNIRERAGWSEQAGAALPKIAALLAEAAVSVEAAPSVTLRSEGVCLVYGRDDAAIAAARQLAPRLDVTVLLDRPEEVLPPTVADLPIVRGTIRTARGHFGAFELTIDDYAERIASSREVLRFEAGRAGVTSRCDLILDLTGGTALFPAADKREGYLRPDPGNPAAVQRALFDLVDLVGEFDKPRYVDYQGELCAHGRNRKIGCTRCLDVCPTGAITPAGDVVAIDAFVCAGCGSCASVCPTGAAGYALPPPATLLTRLRTLLLRYAQAGGERAVVLVHDGGAGNELVMAAGRFGRGLPANVLPFAVQQTTQVGFDFLAAALAYGAAHVVVLAAPSQQGELTGLAQQVGLAEAVSAGLGYDGGRVRVVVESDPDALVRLLYDLPATGPRGGADFLPLGDKRTIMRAALQHLHAVAPAPADAVRLPPGAPFGRVVVDTAGCTLCLACVSACPTGALLDNPERPELRFREDACVQCGLCRNTCPEQVITLEPRIDFTEAASRPATVKQEEPFHCVRCGKPFGTRSSIERIIEKLANKHWMFQDGAAVERIKMCETCRVAAQFEGGRNPLAGGPRPVPRTTDDYLRQRSGEPAPAPRPRATSRDGEGGG